MPSVSSLGSVRLRFPQRESIRALHTVGGALQAKDIHASWTALQWEGFRYLSYHEYWTRIWIVQEVLLASRVVIWCGFFTFPRQLFSTSRSHEPESTPKTRFDPNGRPATIVSAANRLRSPAERVVTHRLRLAIQPSPDATAAGTMLGTLEELTLAIRKRYTVTETNHTQIPDLLHVVLRKFGKLNCSDMRDKLYGVVGVFWTKTPARRSKSIMRGQSPLPTIRH